MVEKEAAKFGRHLRNQSVWRRSEGLEGSKISNSAYVPAFPGRELMGKTPMKPSLYDDVAIFGINEHLGSLALPTEVLR